MVRYSFGSLKAVATAPGSVITRPILGRFMLIESESWAGQATLPNLESSDLRNLGSYLSVMHHNDKLKRIGRLTVHANDSV